MAHLTDCCRFSVQVASATRRYRPVFAGSLHRPHSALQSSNQRRNEAEGLLHEGVQERREAPRPRRGQRRGARRQSVGHSAISHPR